MIGQRIPESPRGPSERVPLLACLAAYEQTSPKKTWLEGPIVERIAAVGGIRMRVVWPRDGRIGFGAGSGPPAA